MANPIPLHRPADHDLLEVLARFEAGEVPKDIEVTSVDFKEEHGRRSGPEVLPGLEQSEKAAEHLVEEISCLSNTPGGGSIILGVSNLGERIGTNLAADWLRHRLYQLQKTATTEVFEHRLADGTRVLLIRVLEGMEPSWYKNRLVQRIDDNCVPVTFDQWRARRPVAVQPDWSAQPSPHRAGEVRATALQIARDWLGAAGKADLAGADDASLLSRLGATTADGFLTNAGAVAFAARPDGLVFDYRRRDYRGGDSKVRLETTGLSGLEALARVLENVQAANELTHLGAEPAPVYYDDYEDFGSAKRDLGAVRRQVPALPGTAVRESLVNAMAHRDWERSGPVLVEHVGAELEVTSPGGFVGGVTSDNIISHPSTSRNPVLAGILQKLGVAEREGIGVDRIMASMVAAGNPLPTITQIDGPSVRTILVGGNPDEEWIGALRRIDPVIPDNDVDLILLLDKVTRDGWIDGVSASKLLQRDPAQTGPAIDRLAGHAVGREPVIVTVAGTPAAAALAWRPSAALRKIVPHRHARVADPAQRSDVALRWANGRGRISTTELMDIVGVARNKVSGALTDLVDAGLIEAGPVKGGRGFHYVPIGR